jgi:hypothetical protein
MTGDRIGPRGLKTLRGRLSSRDLTIIDQVAELRLMSTRQIEALHFTEAEHETPLAAARTCRRVLDRLAGHRLLVRLERRIGGVRSGSASYIYSLGTVGQRVLELDGPRKRFREPSAMFADHTLAISQLVVDIKVASREKRFELLELQTEPACWRRYAGNAEMVVLRPDLYVAVGSAEYEYRWFVEVDRGSEHLPTLLTKCHAYDDYYRTGIEQRATQVFPRVCWIVPDEMRQRILTEKVEKDDRLNSSMFAVTVSELAVDVLAGVSS